MSQLVARLILAMLMLPIGLALLIILVIVAEQLSKTLPPNIEIWFFANVWLVAYAFTAVYWICVWKNIVRWSTRRKRQTALAAIPAILVSIGAFFVLAPWTPAPEPAVMTAGGFAPVIWVLLTVLIWRETPAERIERLKQTGAHNVACPICGYNLTGLSAAQCPECGAKFTLDELLAAQSKSDQTALPEEQHADSIM